MKICRNILVCLLAIVLSIGSFASCSNKVDLEELAVMPLSWAVGAPLPQASEFIRDLPEDVEVRFAEEYQFQTAGVYNLKLILSYRGREIERTAQFYLRLDDTPPTISGVKDISVYIGNGVSYKNGVTVTDDCGGELTLTVDSSEVDLSREGEYIVYYLASDAVGNTATAKAKVYVYRLEVSEQQLNEKLDPVINSIITPGMSKEAQCRAIYHYVFNKIHYTSDAEKGDPIRAAYLGLDKGVGDCYTYFALAKAFFDRLGIENMEIQRTSAASNAMGETHYWNYVNIGDSANPQWYHFDSTHLRDATYNGKLTLVTEEQLQYYNKQIREDHGNFYAYDQTGYPASATKKITTLPFD